MSVKRLPMIVQTSLKQLDSKQQKAYLREYRARKKGLMMAYVAWLLLGWHYLYMGRGGIQIFFWITGGGVIVWWLADCFRLPGMISRMNEDTARLLMSQYRVMAKA